MQLTTMSSVKNGFRGFLDIPVLVLHVFKYGCIYAKNLGQNYRKATPMKDEI